MTHITPKGDYVIDLPPNWDRYGPRLVVVDDPKELEKATRANWQAKVERRLKGHRIAHDLAQALAGFWKLDSYQSWQGRTTLVKFVNATRQGVDAAIGKMVAARVLTQVRLYKLNSNDKIHPIGTVWLPTDPDMLEVAPPSAIAHDLGNSPIRPGSTVDLLVEPAPLPHAPHHVRIIRELTAEERTATVQRGRPKPEGSGRKAKVSKPFAEGVSKPFAEGVGKPLAEGAQMVCAKKEQILERELEEGEHRSAGSPADAVHGVLNFSSERNPSAGPTLGPTAAQPASHSLAALAPARPDLHELVASLTNLPANHPAASKRDLLAKVLKIPANQFTDQESWFRKINECGVEIFYEAMKMIADFKQI